jgi:hypothetical protein
MDEEGNGIPREEKMRPIRVLVCIAVIGLFVGVAVVGDALAGEKVKGRNVYYTAKWQQIEVGDEEGHVVAISETKSITTVFQGRAIPDGLVGRGVGFFDIGKTGVRFTHGYQEFTDKDGDKIYCEWSGGGKWSYAKGTGKFEGIKGGGTSAYYPKSPEQAYSDWEGEVELPKK